MTSLAPATVEIVAAALFALALVHTFSTKFFAHLAHLQPRHAGLWHLFGEVEVVFGFWALVLVIALFALSGGDASVQYLESRSFTEPMFVFVIMVMAASRPILHLAYALVQAVARRMPVRASLAVYFLCLSGVPLLGSLITEPAAMTLAAMLLRDRYFTNHLGVRLQYATLGVLFVNISIGGTLTHYAAPPVLMVAAAWGWDSTHMFFQFGWKAALAVVFNAAVVTWIFRREISEKTPAKNASSLDATVPMAVTAVHLLFIMAVVGFAHHPALFMGLFLFFLGYTEAYKRHQSPLILRQGLLVAFFLAGLVTLGGLQKWWLQPALAGMDTTTLYFAATALTAITDNAALTYLGTLVDGVSPQFKYALVAGAVTGGGLTVIANAPNPAGFSILKEFFPDQAISPLALFVAALAPTCVAIAAFQLL